MALTDYIKIYNSGRQLIINGSYKNLRLKQIIRNIPYNTSTMTNRMASDGVLYYVKDEGNKFPILKYPFNHANIVALALYPCGIGIHTVLVNGKIYIYFIPDDSSLTREQVCEKIKNNLTVYFLTDEQPELPEKGAGLFIWNANGEIIFNSNARYVKILGLINRDGENTDISQLGPSAWYDEFYYSEDSLAIIPFSMHEQWIYNPQIFREWWQTVYFGLNQASRPSKVIINAHTYQHIHTHKDLDALPNSPYFSTNILVISTASFK